ncbi:SET domain-containing protein 4 isoform X2 [Ochotona princeps]|uniref:SET domain-containing protein 4 isoform X2 n=1 Tax=Ochotona princeps TaxID=9978 RepID=UPI002714C544|nr:SET domain-containing protein 4 isoform X2 [Ochotona princeps]
MPKARGRTSRIRRRKCFKSSPARGVNESCKSEFIDLRKWLKDRNFEDRNLAPAHFPGTGRGLMSTAGLQEGRMIISLPECCLLTTDTVMGSYLGAYITKWKPPPSPLLALCTFLVSEKHAGDRSPWKPYLDILPKSYTCPVCLEPEVVDLLPRPLQVKAEEQRAHVREFFVSSRTFFSSLQPLFAEAVDSIFSYSALLWAWCTVNTRAVYLRRRQQEGLSAEPDTCALAPFLDLLNHSPHAQKQDLMRRLVVMKSERLQGAEEILVKYLPSTDKQLNKKISILRDHGFIEDLTFGWDGPSWTLLTALKLLCLEPERFTCWKKILLGEVISDTNEKASLDITRRICCDFIEETSAVLQKIACRKVDCAALLPQLALVEALRTEELQILKASAGILDGLHAAFA